VEPAPEAAPVDLDDPGLATARPMHWVSPAPRRCRRYRRRRFCDGPLRVPEPDAEQAARAERLSLGGANVARHLLLGGPRPEWVAAVVGEARPTLLFPVDGGHLWRGLRRARRRRPRHKGTDIGAPEHTLVRAVNDGLVVYAGNELRGYGNLMMLVHADSSVTFYAHLYAAWLPAGARVRRGQVLGEVGDTGLARGAHLHFEWRVGGHPRDPATRFRRQERPAADAHEDPATTPSTPQDTPADRERDFTDRPEARTNLHVEAAPSGKLS
jgi:murein DD-endopeptidase MepM/ murein hydrolase activator NlpD